MLALAAMAAVAAPRAPQDLAPAAPCADLAAEGASWTVCSFDARQASIRLFLRDPEVILLDEGTSSVDRDTERHILQTVKSLHRQGKTIVSSAHKESALVDAEQIYELRDAVISPVR